MSYTRKANGFVQLSQISLYFGERTIVDSEDILLTSSSRVGLCGINGSGKTTLMKLIMGSITPDGGDRHVSPGTKLSYLPQWGVSYGKLTVREEGLKAFDYYKDELEALRSLEHRISALSQDGSMNDETLELLHEHQERQEALLASPYERRHALVEQVFMGLGFSHDELDEESSTFSGGWQMRIALGKLLLESPDIMLLDEPTNYLDLEARLWLLEFLKRYSGGVLVVSHDRHFLDDLITQVMQIHQGKITHFKGNYSAYQVAFETWREQLIAAKAAQDAERARLEDFIRRFGAKASKIGQVQDREKKLARLEPIIVPQDTRKVHLKLPPAPRSGDRVLEVEHLSKSYDELLVLDDLSIRIERGEKLVLLGPNGAGKSTLMRILSGSDDAFEGERIVGSNVLRGYFSQENNLPLDRGHSILSLMEERSPTELVPRIRDLLGAFLFSGDDVYKHLQVLSGGEISRLRMLLLLLEPLNCLLLDEPTNHLDIATKDILLDALKNYAGTVIFVSHDAYFIEELATRVLDLSVKPPVLYDGSYKEYLLSRGVDPSDVSGALAGIGGAQTSQETLTHTNATATTSSNETGALSYQEQKELKNTIRRLERREAELDELLISLAEKEVALEAELQKPEVYSSAAKAQEITEAIARNKQAQHDAMTEWEAIATELEEMQ